MKNLMPLALILFSTACGSLPSQSEHAADIAVANKQYNRIMSLVGDWFLVDGNQLGQVIEVEQGQPFITYEISSAGNSVVEKLFAGQEKEMTTVYYMDDGALSLAHYCSLGNRPYMTEASSQDGNISFELVRVENMLDANDVHISSHSIEFLGENEMIAHWSSTKDQKPNKSSAFRVMRNP